ncbi:Uncharacterized protein LI90_4336 (plasmid) [Carbonactinospora thermoautotrophica]|uniref:Portal protein n=1 Tax=Carbonactinospora thermoautotrophica TaxID=1469144 RepID=A0A132MHP6_9ACTN|nr:DUF935 family protein [Carbonactinospora thermoautotrophica]KWW97364.1 Uncharacterized protein LI90_4336 [Carbonactinospora thermoautotrophica]
MPTTNLPPEIGHPGGHAPTWTPLLGAGYEAVGYEETPELQFPQSIAVYDRMRRTDAQIGALLRAITLAILQTPTKLTTKGVDRRVVQFIKTELGLQDPGEGRARRRRQGIVWAEHLRLALLALPLGFMPFEQVYEVGPPAPDQEDVGLPRVAHLRKLGPRFPRTLTEIRVDEDGGLAGIVQAPIGSDTAAYPGVVRLGPGLPGPQREVFIPADRLAYYVLDREGADWTGTSILRTAYKHWLIRDALLRLGPQIVERNGMGVPVVYYANDDDQQKALQLAREFRAGAHAGAALPDSMRLELVGVNGSTRDELPLVQYHDQAISRSALAMFLDLGHDNGARSLGDTFVDYFVMSLQAITTWLAETTTEHVIRDLVELNFGADEPYPVLEFDEITSESTPTADALKTLVDAKLLTTDPELEDEVRRRYGLPPKPKEKPTTPTPPVPFPPLGPTGTPGEIPITGEPPAPQGNQPPTAIPTVATAGGVSGHTWNGTHGHPDELLARAEQLVTRIARLREGRRV